jgi:hypothetical protein
MALTAELEKLLTFVPEADREATRKELEAGYLRQADYSRNMNQLKTDRDKHMSEHQKNVDWYKRANDEYKALQDEANSAKARVAELEEARATSGHLGDEDEAALAKELKEARKLAETARKEAETARKEAESIKASVAETEKKFMTKEDVNAAGDNLGLAVFQIIDKMDEYRTEFGKKLDRVALLAEAQKRNGDLESAYEFIIKKDREEKLRTTIEAEAEKKAKEKYDAMIAEARKNGLPVDQGSGEPTMGPLQARLLKKEGESKIPDDVLADGSGRLAALAARELRDEGKF